MSERVIDQLEKDECLRLIAPGGVGRIAYASRFGPAVLPVNYVLHDGSVVFRTTEDSPLDEDLRTGITGADYAVAFEIDAMDTVGRLGWSVLLQGPAHRLTGGDRVWAERSGVESWAPGDRDLFIQVIPTRVTGRRIDLA